MEKENKQKWNMGLIRKETDRHSEDPLLQCSRECSSFLFHVLSWSIKYCNNGGRRLQQSQTERAFALCEEAKCKSLFRKLFTLWSEYLCQDSRVRQLARRQWLVLSTWSQSTGWNTHFCLLPVVRPWRNSHLFLSCLFTGRMRAIIFICRLFQGLCIHIAGFRDHPLHSHEPCVRLGTPPPSVYQSLWYVVSSACLLYSFQGSILLRLLIHCLPFGSNHLCGNFDPSTVEVRQRGRGRQVDSKFNN